MSPMAHVATDKGMLEVPMEVAEKVCDVQTSLNDERLKNVELWWLLHNMACLDRGQFVAGFRRKENQGCCEWHERYDAYVKRFIRKVKS